MRTVALKDSSTLRYFFFFYLYIMQGIPAGFALTAMANYLASQQVDPGYIGTFVAVVGLPWTVQFIWGPLIDRYQYSVIGHRKHWLVLSQLVAVIASLGLLLVKDPLHQIALMSALFCVHSIFASIQDASVDAMAIDVVPNNERGRANAFMRGGFLVGIAMGGAGLSLVLHHFGFRTTAIVQSSILFILTILTFFIKINRQDPLLPSRYTRKIAMLDRAQNPELGWLFREVYKGIVNRKSLRFFMIMVVTYFCFSVFIRSYSYHLIHVLRWPDQSVSVMQGGWGTLITLTVILIGGKISDRIGAERLQVRVMMAVGIFLILLNGLSVYWSHRTVTGTGLVLWTFVDPLYSVAAFPLLMALCLKKVEGSQFTAYMAFINFCDVLGSYVTGWTHHIISAPQLGLICGFIILLLMLLARRLGPAGSHQTIELSGV